MQRAYNPAYDCIDLGLDTVVAIHVYFRNQSSLIMSGHRIGDRKLTQLSEYMHDIVNKGKYIYTGSGSHLVPIYTLHVSMFLLKNVFSTFVPCKTW